MAGKLLGIGVGPGDSKLISVKAVEAIQSLDVIYSPQANVDQPSLALSIAQDYLPEGLRIEVRHFPMVRDFAKKEAQWQGITKEIEAEMDQGLRVGFLTLGDPSTFSTYSYIVERLNPKYSVETIAGITSFNQMAAITNQPLVLDDGAYCVIPATADLKVLRHGLEDFSTIVIMKVANHMPKIMHLLEEYDLTSQAMLISNASMDSQVIIDNLEELDTQAKLSYFTTMIIRKK